MAAANYTIVTCGRDLCQNSKDAHTLKKDWGLLLLGFQVLTADVLDLLQGIRVSNSH